MIDVVNHIIRVPPTKVEPIARAENSRDQYKDQKECFSLNTDLEVFVYTYKGELVNIKSLWRQ